MIKPSIITIAEFNKYVSKPELSNDDFKKIFEELNDSYFEKSKEIFDKNTERAELLDKIRITQNIYKKKLGLKEVEVDLDDIDDKLNTLPNGVINDVVVPDVEAKSDNESFDEKINPKTKSTKKDKKNLSKTKKSKNKKNNDSDEETVSDDNKSIDDLENKLKEEVEKKSIIKKTASTTTKSKPVEQVDNVKETEKNTKSKSTNKTPKSTSKKEEPEEQEPDEQELEEQEETEETKIKKTTKKTKSTKK